MRSQTRTDKRKGLLIMANSKYGRIISIATSVCTVLLGIAFIISTAHLYFTGGDNPYSTERVGDYLSLLIIPSVITIILAILGIVYNLKVGETDVQTTKRTSGELLSSFEGRYSLEDFDSETVSAVKAEKKKVRNLNICIHLVSALLFALSFVYIAFVADYSVEDLNRDVISALAVGLPLAAIGLAIQIPRILLSEKSAERQLNLMKESIKRNGAPKVKAKQNYGSSDYSMIIKYSILGLALVFVVLGVLNGGMADVLEKAVRICTECIGLG
jgi:cytochrome c biogenesis protein CcdA